MYFSIIIMIINNCHIIIIQNNTIRRCIIKKVKILQFVLKNIICLIVTNRGLLGDVFILN